MMTREELARAETVVTHVNEQFRFDVLVNEPTLRVSEHQLTPSEEAEIERFFEGLSPRA